MRQTEEFIGWLRNLRDRRAAEIIAARIVRIQSGLLGDVKYFDGIGELRVAYGPDYRVYFVRRDNALIVLLCGGDRSSQKKDIVRAKQMAKEV